MIMATISASARSTVASTGVATLLAMETWEWTTNQRMEIMAVLEAAKALDGPLEVVSDSTYVINCFRDRWWEGWLQKDWTNSQKRPVVNRDLWEPLIEIVRQRDITFRWVRGHSGDPMNELVDQLAREAARTQQGRQGVVAYRMSPE